MKILVVDVQKGFAKYENFVKNLVESDTEAVWKTPINSNNEPKSLENAVVEEIKSNPDFDAYVIHSLEDIALENAHSITNKPIIGSGQAAFHVAEILSLKFSVITDSKEFVALMIKNARKYGFASKLAQVYSIEEAEEEFKAKSKRDIVCELIKRTVQEDYAEAIVLAVAEAKEWSQELSNELGIPVLDGLPCAVKLAEAVTPLHVTYKGSKSAEKSENSKKKKVVVINANTCEKMTQKIRNNANSFASANTEVKTVTNEHGGPCIEMFIDEGAAVTGIMQRILENSQADAFVIAGYNDMGLDAFRCITDKPVIGSGVASMHVATLLASRFSIVCPLARCIPCIYRTLRNSGFINQCENIRPTNVPVMQFETSNRHEINMNSRIIGGEIEKAILEDKVDAVLLGCSALGHVRQEMVAKFGRPVIDGVSSGVKLCEALISLGVKTSKIGGYAHPYPKSYTGIMSELKI